MTRIVDDLGRTLTLPRPPARIVSLVPSDTFNVAALGAGDRLVGRTDYCVEPASLQEKVPAIGGTKNPRVADILDLRPDLVLANQEENTRSDIEKLERAGIKVLLSFPCRVTEGIAHLARLARVLGLQQAPAAKELIRQGYAMLTAASQATSSVRPLRTFVPIWIDPLMTIHGHTHISDMLALCGAENVFADRERRYPLAADLGMVRAAAGVRLDDSDRDKRYPRITQDELVSRAPEIVLLPDEPYAFGEREVALLRGLDIPAAKHDAIAHCRGRDLCWPGAQAIEGYARIKAQIDALRGRLEATG